MQVIKKAASLVAPPLHLQDEFAFYCSAKQTSGD